MPHVLVAGKLHSSGLALLRSTPGVTHDYVEEISEASYAPLIGAAEGLVIRTQPLSAATVARADKLKIVSRHGVGYDAVDLPALDRRGIALAIVGDVLSASVAEHALMLLLSAAKRAVRADRCTRGGDWDWRNRLEATELFGKCLLVVGYGRIGRQVALLAAAFGMEVLAHDPYLETQGWPEGPAAPAADLHDGLRRADAVSLNLPNADRPVIGVAEFAVMKPGAILVNTARGGVVDEAALIAALRDGRIAAAGIDVFEREPPAPDNPLFAFDQVVLSPHIGGLSAESGERLAVAAVQNVLDFFAGRIDPALVVNGDRLNASR